VTIGVERFGDRHDRLSFALKLTEELSDALRDLGYETTVRAEAELASEDLAAAVREHLETDDADGVLIVHAVTHGHVADGNASVYLLGSDGKVHADTDVAHWLTSLHNVGDRPLTLFLLDLCQAGTVARLPWQASAERPTRGWVIAACRGDRPAYDGRFTRAVVHVLRAVTAGELDIDPSMKYVPLATVAQAIRREVNRLAVADDSYPQQVTASLIDISSDVPDLPFFPNPAYRDDPRARLRAEVDSGLLPFLDDLDEGLDARHFVERAAGVGPLLDQTEPLTGCFTGRADELRRLSPWLSGEGEASLYVVTGSPGVGKSALLGVLVCAAHPLLREQTRPLWDRIAQRPLRLSSLAAVHARQRNVADVTSSLARQLGLQEVGTAADLMLAITRLPYRPVIVVDALDEADNGVELMSELLMPLATVRTPDGGPVARVLVGVRRYEDYSPLMDAASADGGFVDLDEVPARVLEDNLYQYVTELLRTDPAYRLRGAVVGAFASEVARVLSEQATQRREWGEFLVAGLYTRHLLTTYSEPLTDPSQAGRLGAQAPRTLPEVLELDLSTHQAEPFLRDVVTTLAYALGQGMPLRVLTRLVGAFSKTVPTIEDVRRAIQAARFYLRQGTDFDGSILYRLFHQGLADHLQQRPFPHILPYLLAELGPENARNWQAAEPYLLRHVLDHAAESGQAAAILNDPGFLLQPDPTILLRALDGKLADVYRASLDVSARPPRVDRALLVLNAVRAKMTDLADKVSTMPGEPALIWRPRWVIGKPETRPRVVRIPAAAAASEDGTVRIWNLDTGQQIDPTESRAWGAPVAAGELDGRPIAVTGGQDGTVRIWDPGTGQQIGDPMTGHNGPVLAVAAMDLDGRPIAVTGSEDRTVRVWDLIAGQQVSQHLIGHDPRPVLAVAAGELDGRPIAVTGGQDGTVRIWDPGTGQQIGDPMSGHSGPVLAVAAGNLDGRPIAVTGGQDHTVRVWDLTARQQVDMASHSGVVVSVWVGEFTMTRADKRAGPIENSLARLSIRNGAIAIRSLAVSEASSGFIGVVGTDDGGAFIVNLTTGMLIREFHGDGGPAVNVVNCTQISGWPIAILDGGRRTRQVIDLLSGESINGGQINDSVLNGQPTQASALIVTTASLMKVQGWPRGSITVDHGTSTDTLPGKHDGAVTAVACAYLNSRPVAFTGGQDGTVRVWDLLDRRLLDVLDVFGPVFTISASNYGELLIGAGGEVIAFQHASTPIRPQDDPS
jgi:WD40 repeat protein